LNLVDDGGLNFEAPEFLILCM